MTIAIVELPDIPRRHARIRRKSRYAQPSIAPDTGPDPADTIVVGGWQIFPGVAPDGTATSSDGGMVVTKPQCAVLFYGSAWKGSSITPDAGTLLAMFSSVINKSPYLDALMSYGIGSGAVLVGECRIVDKDPPNPFSQDDGADVVSAMIDSYYSTLDPRDRPNMYSVILPPGVAFVSDDARDSGYHAESGGNYFAVVLNGPVDQMTTTFTHEFVETATDPEGDAWQIEPRNDTSWNEICDICEPAPTATINGVAVAPYFANYVGGAGCLVPQPPPPPTPPQKLPNGDYLITNAELRGRIGTLAYLYGIAGPTGTTFWRLTVENAMARMRRGELTFYTMADGVRANVTIANNLLDYFLTTAADDTQLNNLDYIATHTGTPQDWPFWV
jgi:hypothetical protein